MAREPGECKVLRKAGKKQRALKRMGEIDMPRRLLDIDASKPHSTGDAGLR